MIEVGIGAGTAFLVQTDGAAATLQTESASPPGSLLEFTMAGATYRVKVRACRRTDEGARPFRIEGRLVDLTRERREELVRAFAAP